MTNLVFFINIYKYIKLTFRLLFIEGELCSNILKKNLCLYNSNAANIYVRLKRRPLQDVKIDPKWQGSHNSEGRMRNKKFAPWLWKQKCCCPVPVEIQEMNWQMVTKGPRACLDLEVNCVCLAVISSTQHCLERHNNMQLEFRLGWQREREFICVITKTRPRWDRRTHCGFPRVFI